jgi:hypothetical protein
MISHLQDKRRRSFMKFSESVESLLPALIEVQGAMTTPKKSRQGQTGNQKYKYADLSDIMEILQPLFFKHNLFISHPFEVGDNWIKVSTQLRHKSGEWVESGSLVLKGNVSNEKEQGKLLTYGKRYSLCALMGIAADEDTDGRTEGAMPDKEQKKEEQGPQNQQQIRSTQQKRPNAPAAQSTNHTTKSEKLITSAQRGKLIAEAKKRGLDDNWQKAWCITFYKKTSRTKLTVGEASQMIDDLIGLSNEALSKKINQTKEAYQKLIMGAA